MRVLRVLAVFEIVGRPLGIYSRNVSLKLGQLLQKLGCLKEADFVDILRSSRDATQLSNGDRFGRHPSGLHGVEELRRNPSFDRRRELTHQAAKLPAETRSQVTQAGPW